MRSEKFISLNVIYDIILSHLSVNKYSILIAKHLQWASVPILNFIPLWTFINHCRCTRLRVRINSWIIFKWFDDSSKFWLHILFLNLIIPYHPIVDTFNSEECFNWKFIDSWFGLRFTFHWSSFLFSLSGGFCLDMNVFFHFEVLSCSMLIDNRYFARNIIITFFLFPPYHSTSKLFNNLLAINHSYPL